MNRKWMKEWALTLLTGAVLFQTVSCTEPLLFSTAATSAVTAGGVIYIIFRIIND